MQLKNRDEPAYPMVTVERDAQGRSFPGLTKLEFMAAIIAAGLRASSRKHANPDGSIPEFIESQLIAESAVLDAIAVLKECENANK